jgi:hypothetical protein
MSLWPLAVDVRVAAQGRRPFRIWLPLVLFWPLMLAAGLVALILAVCVDAVLLVTARRYHQYSRLLWGCFSLIGDTRGLRLAIDSDTSIVHVAIV